MGGALKPGTEDSSSVTKIDPRMAAFGGKSMDMMETLFGMDPRSMVNMGPTVAAMSDAQRNVMDSTAQAGNAFGLGFNSAANDLPQAYDFGNGLKGYDTGRMAMNNMSAPLQSFFDQMYGEGAQQPQQTQPSIQDLFERGRWWDSSRYGTNDAFDPNDPWGEKRRSQNYGR